MKCCFCVFVQLTESMQTKFGKKKRGKVTRTPNILRHSY